MREQSKEHIDISYTYGYYCLDIFCDVTNLQKIDDRGAKIHHHGWKRLPDRPNVLPQLSGVLRMHKNGRFATLSDPFGHKMCRSESSIDLTRHLADVRVPTKNVRCCKSIYRPSSSYLILGHTATTISANKLQLYNMMQQQLNRWALRWAR